MTRGGRPRTSYFSNRGRPEIDEDTLAKRYVRDHWSITQCAKRFGTTEAHVRAVLTANHIEFRSATSPPSLDESQVVRMYEMHGSIAVVALALDTHSERVREILDRNGAEIGRPAKPRLWDEPDDPSPGDLLRPSQAAQIIGRSEQWLYRATESELIKEADRAETGMRWYRRRDVEDLRDQLTSNRGENADGHT